MEIPETKLHEHLCELFKAMEPNYVVAVTHGAAELGKDLVIVKEDRISREVLAVVVKRGDVRGKTRGEVETITGRVRDTLDYRSTKDLEEIASQIQQALAHPAEAPTIFARLPVSKVFVVLAGEMSNQARTRLQMEIAAPGRVDVFDIEWMIDSFTDHYPQVYFEGKVIDFLHKKIQELETRHYVYKKGKNLSECFIDPRVIDRSVPAGQLTELISTTYDKKKVPFSQLAGVLADAKRIMLLGDPGTGKSIALAKLVIDMLRKTSATITKGGTREKKIGIPILVTAKEIFEAADLDDLLDRYFGSEEVRNRFQVSTLMVDALDEVEASERQLVIDKATMYEQQLPRCSLIVTSRKIDMIGSTLDAFEIYEILPFELGQAIKLFERVVGSAQQVDALKQGLDKIRWQIPMVPLSLMMLIDLVEQYREIPASVTELYDRFLDMALGRYDKERGITVLFEYVVKKRFLSELAWEEFVKKDRIEISLAEYQSFIEAYAARFGWSANELEGFGMEIERAGVLSISKTIVFRHKSFLEYFGAFFIYEHREDILNLNDVIVRLYFDGLWGEVAFFYIGSKRELSPSILDRVMEYPRTGTADLFLKLLVGRLLQAGWHSPTDLKMKGIREAIEYVAPLRTELDKEFATIAQNSIGKTRIPGIFPDFMVMMCAEFAFGSAWLAKEAKGVLKELAATDDNADRMTALHLAFDICWKTRNSRSGATK